MNNNTKNLKEILYQNLDFEEQMISMLKEMLETLMKTELTKFLNYEKYSYDGHHTGNSQNSYYF